MDSATILSTSSLGKNTPVITHYDKSLLFPIKRKPNTPSSSVTPSPVFYGVDIWHAYEISWLNPKGKPHVAIGQFEIPCDSPSLIESKSFKLYLNSINHHVFQSITAVEACLKEDLSNAAGAPIKLALTPLSHDQQPLTLQCPKGICLDTLDIHCDDTTPNTAHLATHESTQIVDETLYSHLLRSNCPVTGQPDWGTLWLRYHGHPIDHHGLLKYIVSYRHHNALHEQCVEQIFTDIMTHLKPNSLEIYAAYTRRGGLDITPFRTTDSHFSTAIPRFIRQ